VEWERLRHAYAFAFAFVRRRGDTIPRRWAVCVVWHGPSVQSSPTIALKILLLLLFIPGENPMGLCGKLLCYVCSGKPFKKKTCAFFAP